MFFFEKLLGGDLQTESVSKRLYHLDLLNLNDCNIKNCYLFYTECFSTKNYSAMYKLIAFLWLYIPLIYIILVSQYLKVYI